MATCKLYCSFRTLSLHDLAQFSSVLSVTLTLFLFKLVREKSLDSAPVCLRKAEAKSSLCFSSPSIGMGLFYFDCEKSLTMK